ncbi:MAG: AAA family ATPase [Bacillota bacterium]
MQLTIEELEKAFEKQGYICNEEIVVTVYLALKMGKPLLITGAPGVGKTEIAKVLSKIFNTQLIRLQCYEGLDENKALYEWNYQRQLIRIQISREKGAEEEERDLFSREYLLERPLLKAIQADVQPVLLIDEIDKTDEEFEAFLFEVLSDFQVSVPELGTITAKQVPMVVLTSNGERELSDGLKRRCIFLHIGYPSVDKEIRIIQAKVPEAGEKLAHQVARAVHFLRNNLDLKKKPAISETLDWARALVVLDADRLGAQAIRQTLNVVLKDYDDLETFHKGMGVDGLCQHLRAQDA